MTKCCQCVSEQNSNDDDSTYLKIIETYNVTQLELYCHECFVFHGDP